MVTTAAIRCVKLTCHLQQPTLGIPFLSPYQQCPSTEGKKYHIFHRLAEPKLTWGLPTLFLTTNGSWLPWERVANHNKWRDWQLASRLFSGPIVGD